MRYPASYGVLRKFSQTGLTLATVFSGACLAGTAALAQAPNFGPNVTIITPSMTPAQVTAALNKVNQEPQFGTNRYAVLFMPGTYGSSGNTVYADVGYYESIAGLGETPGQVTINGGLVADQTDSNGNLTTNFWRSQENLTEVPMGGQISGQLDWGVSQGASLRRLNIQGQLRLANANCGETSGGFTADTQVSGNTNACSQQQWYTRNSSINGWQEYVWNFVFSGVTGAPAQQYPGPNPGQGTTTLATTPVSREKPFLYVDGNGNYNVFVPTLKTNSSGTSWSGGGLGTGYSVGISNFFIAQPSNTVAQINSALQSGKNLILTPGIYKYSSPIAVTNANTIVLGMGYATLVPQSGNAALTVADVDGVQVAGLIVDAGPTNSPVLLEVGNPSGANGSHASNPTSLNDVFFRIGGATQGTATTSLQVDSGNVILDNIWAWRADHGGAPTGWTVNTAAHGVVVNGSNVTALGLAVEHYQKEQVLWNGNGGETIFYQSELPYDVPNQSSWMDGSANGYPSYVVGSAVCTHKAYGLGVYSFFDVGPNIIEDNAITVPNVTGVSIIDAGTVFLSGYGQISHVVNGVGGTASSSNGGVLVPVANYTGSGTCATSTPAAPTGLQATAQAATQVTLTWNASTTTNVTYSVYRSTGSGAATAIATGLTATNYIDKAIAATTTYTYYVVAVNAAGTASAHSNAVTLTTGAGSGGSTIAIDAGGGAVSNFVADTDFSGGGTYSVTAAVSTANVANAAPAAVYQSEREGVFTYTIPGLAANSSHTVRLHFAELYWSQAGQRVFNVSINGTKVLSNFDIVATAGSNDKAVVESFTATANASGQIVVSLTNGTVDQPALSGVEVQ